MAITQTDEGSYVASTHGVWIPGCYDTERAARYALRFQPWDLQLLQDQVNAREQDWRKRVLTFEMLQDLRRATKTPC